MLSLILLLCGADDALRQQKEAIAKHCQSKCTRKLHNGHAVALLFDCTYSLLRVASLRVICSVLVLKLKMKRFRGSESKRLTELTVLSRAALQRNQDALQQSERILMLAELSRKMETEREKVLPFYESSMKEETGKKKGSSGMHTQANEEVTVAAFLVDVHSAAVVLCLLPSVVAYFVLLDWLVLCC